MPEGAPPIPLAVSLHPGRWRPPVDPAPPPFERMAARIEEGAESPSGDRLPPRPKARLSGVSASVSVGRSERYAVTCRAENAGRATWPRSSADGVGLVRPGAPLVAGDGKTAVLDYGRADLPRDLAPGASEIVAIDLTVRKSPASPGWSAMWSAKAWHGPRAGSRGAPRSRSSSRSDAASDPGTTWRFPGAAPLRFVVAPTSARAAIRREPRGTAPAPGAPTRS
jgi:hypothetical protein